jgi:hypothetical protein
MEDMEVMEVIKVMKGAFTDAQRTLLKKTHTCEVSKRDVSKH